MFRKFFDPRRDSASYEVSVVIPLYNHARYIGEAVGSVIAQGKLVKELIVIDDGSLDNSAEVMRALAPRDQRIVFLTQDNQGAHATINSALRRCSGKFVSILNSDDAYLPGRLSALVSALDADPAAGMAASTIAFMNDTGAATENTWYGDAIREYNMSQKMDVALINGNFLMTTSNFLFRRSLLEEVGYFASLRYAHDLDFALRVLSQRKKILIVDQPLVRYRTHATNTISEDHRRVRVEWAICAASYFALVLDNQNNSSVDWSLAASLEDVLRRHDLTKAVHLIMTYLRRTSLESLDRNPILADTEFLNRASEWV